MVPPLFRSPGSALGVEKMISLSPTTLLPPGYLVLSVPTEGPGNPVQVAPPGRGVPSPRGHSRRSASAAPQSPPARLPGWAPYEPWPGFPKPCPFRQDLGAEIS